jgi:hypothetical protein
MSRILKQLNAENRSEAKQYATASLFPEGELVTEHSSQFELANNL